MQFNSIVRLAYALLALVILGVTLIRADSTAATAGAPTPAPFAIADFSFKPATLHVPVGATVHWTNKDEVAHTVTTTGKPAVTFDSGNMDQHQSFTFAFAKAGTYDYVCTYHPNMTGKIIVGASPPPK
jgi:plastocyanin